MHYLQLAVASSISLHLHTSQGPPKAVEGSSPAVHWHHAPTFHLLHAPVESIAVRSCLHFGKFAPFACLLNRRCGLISDCIPICCFRFLPIPKGRSLCIALSTLFKVRWLCLSASFTPPARSGSCISSAISLRSSPSSHCRWVISAELMLHKECHYVHTCLRANLLCIKK